MTFCSSSKVAVFSLLTIDVYLCLNMSEDLNQIYCRRSLDMNSKSLCPKSVSTTYRRLRNMRRCIEFGDNCMLLF